LRARRLSAAVARAAARARGSMVRAPSNSKALIMSMISSATRHSSGALPWRSCVLAAERGIERRSERCLAAHQRIPAELVALALAFRHEFQPLGRDCQHVGLPRDLDFAF